MSRIYFGGLMNIPERPLFQEDQTIHRFFHQSSLAPMESGYLPSRTT